MKKLICELCGSSNIIKENGLYVCQSCSTQYSVEEARKLMIEGTVHVQGTVQIDTSSQVENYYVNARRAMNQEDWHDVEKYYDLILQNDPSSIEAIFYSDYGRVNLSLYDTDLNKRRQNFNVLINDTALLADTYTPGVQKEFRNIIERINQDIIRLTQSQYVYNSRKNDIGMVVQTDREETSKLLVALECAFIRSLEKIMQIEPQSYINELILEHANYLHRTDEANRAYYSSIIHYAVIRKEHERLLTYFEKKPEGSRQYLALYDELCSYQNSYKAHLEAFHDLQAQKASDRDLSHAAKTANADIRNLSNSRTAIYKHLNSLNIPHEDFIILPEKITTQMKNSSKEHSTLGIISFIIGIISILCICLYSLGTFLAPIGMLLGIIAIFNRNRTHAYTILGIVLNTIALFAGAFLLLIILGYSVGMYPNLF